MIKVNTIKEAIPGQPVEVLGANSTPLAGDIFNVTKDESKGTRNRRIPSAKKIKEVQAANAVKDRTTMEQILLQREEGEKTKLPIIIRGDVHGSVEAISGSLDKMVEENEGIEVNILFIRRWRHHRI